MPKKEEIESMIQEYNHWHDLFGDDHRSVGWPKDSSARFRALLSPWLNSPDFRNMSILDYGCGLGHLIPHIEKLHNQEKYVGIDLNEKLISSARTYYPNARFYSLAEIRELPKSDLVIASGIFNRKFSDSTDFLLKTTKHLLQISKIGFSFNVLSEFAFEKYEKNYYATLDKVHRVINREYSDSFIIDGHSLPGEFTIHLFK